MIKLKCRVSIFIGILFLGAGIPGQSQDDIAAEISFPGRNQNTNASKKDTIPFNLEAMNKKFGIGINPLRSLINIGYELNLRGAVSLFAVDPHAEISFPIQYIQGWENDNTYRVFYLEATYRRFFNSQIRGTYCSAGLRYRYIEGEQLIPTNIPGDPYDYNGIILKQSNIGLYAGIGYRHFTKKGLYWGGNIIIGIYFGPKIENIVTDEDLPLNFILGCDLFEIGYSF